MWNYQDMRVIKAVFVFLLLFATTTSIAYAQVAEKSVRFYGNGASDIDRIKIQIDNPQTILDIGNTDFTIEWWMKATLSENTPGGSCTTGADGWINGNIIIDRDIWGEGDYGDFGVSVYNTGLSFGVHNGTSGSTICSTLNVKDNTWHHIAVQRRRSDGFMWLYVDGQLRGSVDGPDGDISYRNGRNGMPDDPYLVIGAEKHDYDNVTYPSYSGYFDELRISSSLRYTANFTRPNTIFSPDSSTVVLYHFNEGSGIGVTDASNNLNTSLSVGGTPSGPIWIADSPFIGVLSLTPTFSPTLTMQPSISVTLTPCQNPFPGDANCDSKVDGVDYVTWLTNYGLSTANGARSGDFNADSKVDGVDYITWLTNYGKIPTLTVTTAPTNSPTPTLAPTATLTPTQTPTPTPSGPTPTGAQSSIEWSQHAHDAQRTSYSDTAVPTPWRWKWSWNGPTTTGTVSSGKTSLPRNVEPVTGGGRVYVAAGSRGVYALNQTDTNGDRLADIVWNATNVGTVNSTIAYDADTNSVFVVSTNGNLYKLNAATGAITGQHSSGSSSTLPLPPAVISDRVFYAMGNNVYAINKSNMNVLWNYSAGTAVHTPPSYSPSRNRVVVVSQDLFVHAINNSNGVQAWRSKPTPRTGGNPGGSSTSLAEASRNWPVIAEVHGYVFVKYRLDWQSLWVWNPWPIDNASMRSNLTSRPEYQALYALDLDDGVVPFTLNVGHGGYGDGDYMPMGSAPVVKRFSNGQEVLYTFIRGSNVTDGRWDSAFGEVLLDNTTVSGYQAGYVRFIHYGETSAERIILTDEQPNISMAGDYLFGGHWMAGYALQITNRTSSLGSYSNRIQSVVSPHILTSSSSCAFTVGHYCSGSMVQNGDARTYPPGFYIYYNQGTVYDAYWSEYAKWTVSNGIVFFRSNDGAIVALENGTP